jgi:hypothetical protein
MEHDAFICHATEDKDEVARPLAIALQEHGLKVWYDEFKLKIGDSLVAEIERGLQSSRFGIVVLSRAFFRKNWTKRELATLANLENAGGRTIILPVWHNVDADYVRTYSPLLADRIALSTSIGIGNLAQKIARRIQEEDREAEGDLDTILHERAATVARVLGSSGRSVRDWNNELICPRCHNRVEAATDATYHQCDTCAFVFAESSAA